MHNTKVLLITPSNTLFMPYVDNYINVIHEQSDVYTICWDRFNNEKPQAKKFIFKDKKVGHSRRVLDYVSYKKFIQNIIKQNKFDKIIVFGIQLMFFLQNILKKYTNNYVIDIRDYHKLIKFLNINKVVENSYFTVISSEGYKEWLPNSNKYVINHNLYQSNIYPINDFTLNKICIGYVGSITHYEENIKLIDALKNNPNYNLTYNGLGVYNEQLTDYIFTNNIHNVEVNGVYQKNEEKEIYQKIDFVNILLDHNHLNNKTCMANRFYNAIVFGKPIVIYKDSFMANLVEHYKLGVVIKSSETILMDIEAYINKFSVAKYEQGRHEVYKKIIEDNYEFDVKLRDFIGKKN